MTERPRSGGSSTRRSGATGIGQIVAQASRRSRRGLAKLGVANRAEGHRAETVATSAGGWRVAARLARREVRRRPGRTALVMALVAVPVAGMLVAVALLRTGELSSTEQWRLEYGRADAVLHWDAGFTRSQLPEGTRTLDYVVTWGFVGTTGGELCRCELSDVPSEPLTNGIVTLTAGRHPERRDEVLLSDTAADALGTGLGERIELTRPFALDATVVGVGYESLWRDKPLVVVAPDSGLLDHDSSNPNLQRLVDFPDDMTADERFAWEEQAGSHVVSPAYPMPMMTTISGDNANVGVRWTWAGGAAALTVLGIVVAAAFTASARRQLATLGQLAANGATPALLRRVLFLQGTVTGLLGSVTGLVLGTLLLVAARSRAAWLVGHAVPGWEVRLLDVLPIFVIGVVAAPVAASIPAFGASRVSVLTALAGRRPLGQVSRRTTTLGLVAIAAGTGLLGFAAYLDSGVDRVGETGNLQGLATACAVAGPVLLLLGVCTATPAYVTLLRPVARGARGRWRLAARSLFRQRTRTSAMVSAICAISALAVAAAATGLAVERDARTSQAVDDLPDDVVRIGATTYDDEGFEVPTPPHALEDAAVEVQAVLPGAERYDVAHAVDPDRRAPLTFAARDFVPGSSGAAEDGEMLTPEHATIVDEELLRVYGVDAATRRVLDEVGAVVPGPQPGRVTIEALPQRATVPAFRFEAGVVGLEHAAGFGATGELLLTPQRARELGLVAAPAEVVLRTPEPLTAAQRDGLDRVALQFEIDAEDAALAAEDPSMPTGSYAWLGFDRPRGGTPAGLVETVPAAVALLFALFVVAVGLALAAVETRDERDVLTVLGAPPRLLRQASGSKAFLLTLLGSAAAVPVGLVPMAVVTRLMSDGPSVVVPWRTIALLVVAVPVLAAAITSTAARVASRYRPVRVSTATFG